MHTISARICADYGEALHFFNQSGQSEPVASLRTDQRPVVGDWVELDPEKRVISIRDRASGITRIKSDGTRQILAANVDQIWVLFPLDREPSFNRWQRFCRFAESQGFQPTVVLTKSDLCANPNAWVSTAFSLGYGEDIHLISSATGDGVESLASHLSDGKTALLFGQSGVGKSSLANALCADRQAVAPVRALDNRGKHVTTTRRLLQTRQGGYLLDIPGLRELSWEGQEELPDGLRAWADNCRFRDCNHLTDEGCGLIQAVQNGQVSQESYEHWKKLAREAGYQKRREDPKMASNSKLRWKAIHKESRKMKKSRNPEDLW